VSVLEFTTEERLAENTPAQVALIPLLLYLTSTGISSIIEHIFQKIGRKNTFSIGCICMIVSATGLALIDPNTKWVIYIIAILIGATQALVLNTGITLISEVIGVRGSSGAFVFGCYSFLDKIATGIVLFAITSAPAFTAQKTGTNSYFLI
jgi:Na+/melibiose symporter-like transporter